MSKDGGIKNIFISAGESSGDVYGARLAGAFQRIGKNVGLYGFGLSLMRKAGVELLADMQKHSVMGVTEILSSIFENYKNIKDAGDFFKKKKIEALILIDYAGFNLELARAAKNLKIPVFYFIPPKLWAWGEFRVGKLKNAVDKIYTIFPFEVEFFKKHGIDAEFYGHPIYDIIKECGIDFELFRKNAEAGLQERKNHIVLMPGSREAEVKNHIGLMIKCAERINNSYAKKFDGLKFFIPMASSGPVDLINRRMKKAGFKYEFIFDEFEKYKLFGESILALAASGTATLELALFGVPSVIIYKVALATEMLGRFLVNSKYIGLPNILHDMALIPELFQREANFENVSYHAGRYMDSQALRNDTAKALLKTSDILRYDPAVSPTDAVVRDILKKVGTGF